MEDSRAKLVPKPRGEMMDVHAVELMGEDGKADQEAFGDPVAGGWCPNQEAAGAIGWGGHLP